MKARVWFTVALVAGFGLAQLAHFPARADDKDKDKKDKSTKNKMITTKSGLQYQDLKVGTGKEAKKGDIITVHFTGWLADGKKFDSSVDRKRPIRFKLGNRDVIPGWEEGLQGMKEKGERKLIVPPKLAYGEDGKPPEIPKNATLTFEIELLKVTKDDD
jgi:FKBP-type peptidyl-prolyl cis-trans isomerase FkpA